MSLHVCEQMAFLFTVLVRDILCLALLQYRFSAAALPSPLSNYNYKG